MPELHLQRNEDILTVSLGELSTSVPLAVVLPNTSIWQRISEDAAAYGRDLFEQTFHDEQMRTMLTAMRAKERLLLIADDPLVAQIPWEYLRDENNKLLAGRLTFVRSVPAAHPLVDRSSAGSLEIVAIPVSPIDEPRVLNVEREWRNLVEAVTVTTPLRALTLKRVRPPTCTQLGLAMSRQAPSIIHFMGHSASRDDKAFLEFEDARGRSHLIDAADFVDTFNEQAFLVVLNSCLSATVAATEFGNIAQALVRRGIPYALGMQYSLPDNAALVLSRTLYGALLQGHTVEEAVMQTRSALQEPGKLPHPDWLAGIPVLYTSQRVQPAMPLELASGQPIIQPDPQRLEQTCDLTALSQAEYFVGRTSELSQVLEALLSPSVRGFIMLHGLGGIGKTSLAQRTAERVGWYYQDQILAYSFETFASLDATTNQRVVNEAFVDRFYNRLARFYDLDPARYPTTSELQQAILQRRAHMRSLLVFDNIETLIDAQRDQPAAQACAAFISRLKEGDGTILLTSRMVPPSDWGTCQIIPIGGLSEEAGSELFQVLLPQDRAYLAPFDARLAISRRVRGHPLSIRLLAGRFADDRATDLTTFLTNIEEELTAAEQKTPGSLEDLERQKTLYACMEYSAKRLSSELRTVLDTVSIFQASFLLDFASYVLNDSQQTPLHLQNLARLGLLNVTISTFEDGELVLFDLHPVVRWYIQQHQPDLETALLERYGQVYESLVREAAQPASTHDHSTQMRFLIRQSFVDCEVALAYLAPTARCSLSYHLAHLYDQLGQNRRALILLEQALNVYQELGDVRGVAVTQQAMANVLVQQGKVGEALALYEQSLRTKKELGDVRGVAVTQQAMANVLVQQGKVGEALALYEQSLRTKKELGNVRGVAVTQQAMANVLVQQGKVGEALALYEQSLRTKKELGNVRGVAVTQQAMADVLVQQGKVGEALALYEQSLRTKKELGDVRGVAVTQHAMADVLVQQGKVGEALALYEQSLRTKKELGDVRGVAMTQQAMANVLVQQGKVGEALALYEQSLRTKKELGDVRGVAMTQQAMANVLVQQGKVGEALALYEQSLRTKKELGDVRGVAVTQQAMANVLVQQGKVGEALALYEQSLRTSQELGDVRGVAVTQQAMANVLVQQGKVGEALALYEQSLRTSQELGDVRGVAVTQQAMANVLVQQGKVGEAPALYEQSLRTSQELGNVRGMAVTQQAMANVLVQQGKVGEALALYEQSLRTSQELGDVREVAVTQANMSQLLLRQGELRRALRMAWEAYMSLSQHGFSSDAQAARQVLFLIKGRVGGAQFDQFWQEEIEEVQPEWLRDAPTSLPGEGLAAHISDEVMQAVRDYVNAEDWDATRRVVEERHTLLFLPEVEMLFEQNIAQAQHGGEQRIVKILEQHLALLRDCKSRDIAAAFEQLKKVQAEEVPAEVMQAVREYVNAQDWSITRQVVEERQKLLFQPEVEVVFEQNIARARADGEQRILELLELHLALLRDCRSRGIAVAFEQLEKAQPDSLPFPAQLIARSIEAILGSPQEKMAHMQYLTTQAAPTTDEQFKALLNTIQLALFSTDLSQIGRDLVGVYRQAWETIASTVEAGGVEPCQFEAIANNTVAVLGPAANQRSAWRNNLADIRNQTTARGDRNMAALLDAVIGLMDADGKPEGLGDGLKGIYANTWRAIVEHLSPDQE